MLRRGWMVASLVLWAACGGTPEEPVDPPRNDRLPPPLTDADGDGLDDAWETEVGDLSLLDPSLADTDGDSVPDGDEDPDGDGLTNLQEYLLSALPSPNASGPDPSRWTLLVELDSVSGKAPSDETLRVVIDAYAAAPISSPGGIDLQIFRDQEDVESGDFSGSFSQRHLFLKSNGPHFAGKNDPRLPVDDMIHVVIATRRTDRVGRGGEVVAADDDPAESGVLIFYDVLDEIHPQCGRPGLPPITLDEAIAATMTHEVGHTLQLGHDTSVGGGINLYNIMSVPSSCDEAQKRFHGHENQEDRLGNTEAIAAPRFSEAAANLMDFDNILSVHTAHLVNDSGIDM